MKKLIFIFTGIALYAKSYLVVIHNPVPEDIPVITSLKDFSISIFSDEELRATDRKLNYQIVDEYSPDNVYYLVKQRFGNKKPEGAFILFEKNGEYIVKGTPYNLDTRFFFVKKLSSERRLNKNYEKIRNGLNFINPTIQEIVLKVENDSILNFVVTLQNFITRNSHTPGCTDAANWAKNYMENQGLDSVYLHSYQSSYAPNVVGIKWGQTDSCYVITAHLDATIGNPWWPEDTAPGADDNGSGSSAVLEAVRVMEGYNFHYTVKYILFTGEEQGLVGSEAWCNQHSSDPILGDINLDMIGYVNFYPESLDLVSDNPSQWLMDSFVVYTQNYVPQLKTRTMVNPNFWYSDHSSFWDIGKSAILGIEDVGVPNPYYHSKGDTVGGGFNSIEFCSDVIRASVAALSGLARPVVSVKEKATLVKGKILYKRGMIYFSESEDGSFYRVTGEKIFKFKGRRIVDLKAFKKGIYFIKLKNKSYRILIF